MQTDEFHHPVDLGTDLCAKDQFGSGWEKGFL